jgi:hypothetical protein
MNAELTVTLGNKVALEYDDNFWAVVSPVAGRATARIPVGKTAPPSSPLVKKWSGQPNMIFHSLFFAPRS